MLVLVCVCYILNLLEYRFSVFANSLFPFDRENWCPTEGRVVRAKHVMMFPI